jgi:hypothetical protein
MMFGRWRIISLKDIAEENARSRRRKPPWIVS